jgi:hypothetical protein
MRLLIAVCCVVAWGGVACAEGRHGDTIGAGGASCAEYGKAYQKEPERIDQAFLSWAQGYLTGVNSRTDFYFDLGGKSPRDMLLFLRKYCNDHPLANFMEATEALLKLLPPLKHKE